MKKNIIFPIEFNHFTGGMIHSVVSLVKYLSEEYNVFILVHKDAQLLHMKLNATPLILKNPWSINVNSPFKTLRTYFEVRKLMKPFNKKDTIVFTNNVGSEMIFSGFGIFPICLKRVFVSRGGDYRGKTGAILKRGFKSVYRFIAISNSEKQKLLRFCSNKKVKTIHNGVFIEDNCTVKRTSDVKVFNLSIVGYINSNKNQILAVRALAELLKIKDNLILNIYGIAYSSSDKIYEDELLKEISILGVKDNVFFKGFENNKEIIYKNTDILISCSLSEGFGRTIVEAMAFGVPCIGLKESGGLLDIITDGVNGFLISNNVTELVNRVLEIYNNPSIKGEISTEARNTYNTKFTENIMCKNYREFIQEIF